MRITFFIILISFLSCTSVTNKPSQKRSIKSFKESLNTAVFTTKFIVIDNKEITLVRHDVEDGAWTFFSDDKYNNYEEVAKIVSLGQLINIDSTILEIADMPQGYYAQRNSKRDDWVVQKLKEK